MRENKFQADLKKDIRKMFPGCVIAKLDSGDIQGIPDLLILYEDRWAILECKKSEEDAKHPRPNQPYYVDKLNRMSFSRFIYPENKEEVLDDLYEAFESRRTSRTIRR